MFAIANVRRYVEDRAEQIGAEANEILRRAEMFSLGREWIHHELIGAVIRNDDLEADFKEVVRTDRTHIMIELAVQPRK